MSDISREESIKLLEKSAPICVCTPNAFERFGFAINKAISDMQKLEKIEKIIDEMHLRLKDFENDEEWDKYESALSMKQIEQIVKEVKE